ncbi:MAG: HNH endonuclease [bacterium]|nr:HNH endonuclease [bacterium]MCM1376168.1 HNH endonuclease [Muribaculum sp.]
MVNRNGIKWSREETILAYDLYCRTSFGKIGQTNPDIIELATLLGRTPGSVGLKMHNLAHYDPELQKRNVTAMAHGSKLDKEIFMEFAADWTELSYQAQLIKAKMQKKDIIDIFDIEDIEEIPAGKYREKMMKQRVGQYFFRMSVLNSYRNCCCITGLAKSELLVASHIKPWKVSNEKTERTNPCNGLCLNYLHDKAFDRGLITISKEYRIIISNRIKEAEMDGKTRDWFWGYNYKQIFLPDKFLPGTDFIEYHNDVIFQR